MILSAILDAVAALTLLGCLFRAGYRMAFTRELERLRARPIPKPTGPSACERFLSDQVWDEYHRDRISLVSALLRVEALFAARVAEITDWDALDWTTSPLEPKTLGWVWDGDKLAKSKLVKRVLTVHPTGATVESTIEPLRRAHSSRCTCSGCAQLAVVDRWWDDDGMRLG